jgi:ankyrin repeat protein
MNFRYKVIRNLFRDTLRQHSSSYTTIMASSRKRPHGALLLGLLGLLNNDEPKSEAAIAIANETEQRSSKNKEWLKEFRAKIHETEKGLCRPKDQFPTFAVYDFCRATPAQPLELLEHLVKAHPEQINQFKGHKGRTPLHAAVRRSRPDLVAELIRLGADANIFDAFGQSPLLLAAVRVENGCFSVLLPHTTSYTLNRPRKTDNCTCLNILADRGDPALPSLKLILGVPQLDVNHPLECWRGTTALHHLAKKNKCASLVLMLQRPDVKVSGGLQEDDGELGDTPLISALRKGQSTNIYLLVAAGADIHEKNKKGTSFFEMFKQLRPANRVQEMLALVPASPPAKKA